MSIRVAIVEDERSMRDNLAAFIDGTPSFACVAACANAEEALRRIPLVPADVALVDINLPGRSGVDLVRELKERCPQLQIIMLTVEAESQPVFESLKAGATGYLVKHVVPQEILDAIHEVHAGGAPMSSQVARMVVSVFREPPPSRATEAQLTERESEILKLLACGDRSKEIAEKLGIGVGTVNTHIRHVYDKLHVRSRAEAVARFLRPS